MQKEELFYSFKNKSFFRTLTDAPSCHLSELDNMSLPKEIISKRSEIKLVKHMVLW